MLDNHGNEVKKTIRYSGSLEEQLDKWYVIYAKREEISKRTGKLKITDTDAWICTEVDMDTRIEAFYDSYKNYFWKQAYKHSGYLDKHDMEGIIRDCIHRVLKEYDIADFNKFHYLMWSKIGGACADEAKKRKAIKRGGQTKFVYLDDPNTFLNLDTKEDITKIELKVWAEQIKSNLTTNEYKYIKLLLNISYIPTNREVAYLLNMTPEGVRYIKNSLKSKLPSLF